MIYNKYNNGAVHHLQYKTNKKYKRWADWLVAQFPKPSGDTLLDLACGDGLKSKLLFQKGYDVTGIDCSEIGIHRAKKLVMGAQFYIAEVASIFHWDIEFDYCLASEIIEHMEDQLAVVDIMDRVDKAMIVTTPDKDVAHREDRFHVKELNWPELKELFKDYNVERLEGLPKNGPFNTVRTMVARITHKTE